MKFVTINVFCKENGLPTNFLRSLVKQGAVPGFFSGNRFLINRDAAIELFSKMSTPAAQEADND